MAAFAFIPTIFCLSFPHRYISNGAAGANLCMKVQCTFGADICVCHSPFAVVSEDVPL